MTAVNYAYLNTTVTSDGVLLDTTPPQVEQVHVDVTTEVSEQGEQVLFVSWNGFYENETMTSSMSSTVRQFGTMTLEITEESKLVGSSRVSQSIAEFLVVCGCCCS